MPVTLDPLKTWTQKVLKTDHIMLALAALIGFLAGLASSAFRRMIEAVEKVFSVDGLSFAGIDPSFHPYSIVLFPMVGGLIIGVICRYFPDAVSENGVPQVIHAAALRDSKIRKRTLLTCSTTTAITLGSGGSGGREGPIVHLGSAIGSTLGQWLNFSSQRVRILLGCGAAGAIAATFNTPLAGVLFALEIILGDFTLYTFSPIIIASVIGTATGWALEGDEITFLVPIHAFVSYYEIFFYVALGFVCGLAAILFTKVFSLTQKVFAETIQLPAWVKPGLGGLLVGLIAIFTPQVRGNGYNYMEQALSGELIWQLALVLVFTKIIATSLSLGSGGMGGIVAPSLFIGSMVGASFGTWIHIVFPDISATAGTYSLIGMASVAAAVMQAPLTCILMLFELTKDYAVILPIMVSCIISAHTYRGFSKSSIFIQRLLEQGVNIKYGREASILSSIRVGDVMNRKMITIREDMPFKEIVEAISHSRNLHFPVTDPDGAMTGILSYSNIRSLLLKEENNQDITAKDLASADVVTLKSSDTLLDAMDKFAEIEVEQLPVVKTDEPGKVIGMLSRWEVSHVYNREVIVSRSHH